MELPLSILTLVILASFISVAGFTYALISRNYGLSIISAGFVCFTGLPLISQILPEPAASIVFWLGIGIAVVINGIFVYLFIHMHIYEDHEKIEQE